MAESLIASISKSLGSTGVVTACSGIIAQIATVSSPAAVLGVLGSSAAATAPFAGLLVLGGVLDWTKGKRTQAEVQDEFSKIHRVLSRMESIKCEDAQWLDLLNELLEGRVCKSDTAETFGLNVAQIRYLLKQQGVTITTEMEQGFIGVRIYLTKITDDLEEIKAGTNEILTGQQRTEKKVDQITEFLLSQNTNLTVENQDLRQQIHDAISAKVDAEQSAGRSPDTLLDELRQGDTHRLLEFLDQCVENDEHRFVERHRERAAVAYVLGDYIRTEQSLKKILLLIPNDIDAINRLGHIDCATGNLVAAQCHYQQVLDQAPNQLWKAIALGNLGLMERMRGNLDAAEQYLKDSLAIQQEIGYMREIANLYSSLGGIEKDRGNLNAAEQYLKDSLAIMQDLGDKQGMAISYGNLGLIEQLCGNLDVAEQYLKESLAIKQDLGNKQGMAYSYNNLGLLERARGNLNAAEQYLKDSLAIRQDLGNKQGMASSYGNLGLIEKTRGNLDAAEQHLKESLAICNELGNKEGIAISYSNLGGIENDRGHVEAARGLWIQANDLFAEIGMPHMTQQLQSWIDGLE
jgi:tetratricopeptide (TPR) repeat protein